MKNLLISALFLSLTSCVYGQNVDLSVFDNLVGKTWQAEGKWGDGSKFKQALTFEYALGKSLVLVKAKGFTDKEQTKYDWRNVGIRKVDKEAKKIKFWEFDVFGGTTEGDITVQDKNILYQYKYGNTMVSDLWEYVNDSTYNFTVGSRKNGEWAQKYLSCQFTAEKQYNKAVEFNQLKKKMLGTWIAENAKETVIKEWTIDENGELLEQSTYLKNDSTRTKTLGKIEHFDFDNEVLLLYADKDNSMKMYKAFFWTKEKIAFANTDYEDNTKVTYYFKDNNTLILEFEHKSRPKSTGQVIAFKRK